MNFPLPPKNADVVQKLQPRGHPTDGIIVAAVPPLFSGQGQSQDARLHAGDDFRMLHRMLGILPEVPTHPRYALALHEVIGVNPGLDAREEP